MQLAAWAAFALSLTGGWLIPRTRHGWLLNIAAAAVWAGINAALNLWAGVAGSAVGAVVAVRCWRKRVTASDRESNRDR